MPFLFLPRRAATLPLVAVMATASAAQTPSELASESYGIDSQHSTVSFSASLFGGIHVRGRFTQYDATVVVDPHHPERSSVTAIIDAKSLTTDMAFRDDHLRSPDFFDVKSFPTIVFVSDKVTPVTGGATVSGMLTMHGATRRITFPAHLLFAPQPTPGNIGRVAFTAELKVNRNDFGIAGTNKYNPSYNPLTSALGDSVDILLEMSGYRPTYADRTLGTGTPPGVADTVNRVLQSRGVQVALETFRTLRASRPNDFRFTAGQLDVIGHQLAERGALRDAIQVLEYNAELFADTPGVLESLGAARAMANDGKGALDVYRRVLVKFPDSSEAREMIRHLETSGQTFR